MADEKVERRILRVCLLGAGRMGRVRAPLLYANTRVNLLSIVDVDGNAGCAAMADEYGCESVGVSKFEEHLRERNIEALWVSTPTFTHKSSILTALKVSSVKTIFTEKPVEEHSVAIQELFDACEAKGVKLLCGFQRRFDPSYASVARAVQSGSVGNPQMVRIMFGDHPAPPMEFLIKGGDPFMDLSPHDVDYVRWALGDEATEVYATGSSSTKELDDAGVLDNATMLVKFSRGAVCTLAMSRGATYGYDQRCEIFGDKGLAQVGNIHKTSSVIMNDKGIHCDVLQHSFPQRFFDGFNGEVNGFVAAALDGATWPITVLDCIAAQDIASAASASASAGQPVRLGTLAVRPIGSGEFGSYIAGTVGREASIAFMPPFTRTAAKNGDIDWNKDVLGEGAPPAVYVCSPDKMHKPHAVECLNAGKHVLVEKPVHPDFEDVVRAAGDSLVLMVGFHRRFYADFIKCREYCSASRVKKVTIRSLDPVPAESDMLFVLRNSVCHDVDMLGFLFPDSDVAFTSSNTSPQNSGIELSGTISLQSGESVAFDIVYAKCHASYVQEVAVESADGTKMFGKDCTEWDQTCCEMYASAYRSQWREFNRRVLNPGLENATMRSQRMQSYAKTFTRLEDAARHLKLLE